MNENLLTGIYNIVQSHITLVREDSPGYNIRINNDGEKLEVFVKDAIADTFKESTISRNKKYSEVYSWLGSQNNPPDLIIKNGDAFEIKKIENTNLGGNLALNSSHPKNKLYADDTKITRACRECENNPWTEKDIFYTIGIVPRKAPIKTIFFVQGLCYVADREVYEKLHNTIKDKTNEGITSSGYTSDDTKEIGRINKVDPLGITNLRIRGMWEIKNPYSVFNEYIKFQDNFEFSLYALLTEDKYNSYPEESRNLVERDSKISIKNVELPDPNNLAKLINAKIISAHW